MHKAAELYAKSTDHPEQLPALTLAFVGDAVYEIYVRTMMLEKSVNAHTLNKACVQLVNNRTQSALYDVLAPAARREGAGRAQSRAQRQGHRAEKCQSVGLSPGHCCGSAGRLLIPDR